jgi:hypothetical protein
MEYTQGFSSHPRTAFGPPLPVGVVGFSEPAEFWFREWGGGSLERWRSFMPGGFEIAGALEVSGVSLAKLCRDASYTIEPLNETPCADIERVMRLEFGELGTLLSIHSDQSCVTISVTDPEKSGASRMVKSLVAASMVSGWRDLAIGRLTVGRWDEGEARVVPLSEEILR